MSINEMEAKVDRRVKRTRKMILDAFCELRAAKDFNSITVQDIAERADINRATFYLHYVDKYALLTESVREALREMLNERLPESEILTMTNLQLLTIAVGEFMAQFSGTCYPSTRTEDHPMTLIITQVQQYLEEILLAWIKRSQQHSAASKPVSPEEAASALSWVIFGTAFPPPNRDRNLRLEARVEQTLAFLAPSLEVYLEELSR